MSVIEKILAGITAVAITVFIVIITLISAKLGKLNKELEAYKNAPADTVVVVKTDTISIDRPVEKIKYISQKEYVEITDTLMVYDTVVKIWKAPREYLVYQDTTYRAVVSGVDPRLDTLKIYRPTIIQTITKYVKTPPPFFKGLAGAGVMSQIGGEKKDCIVRAIIGGEIKNKVILQAEYGRGINTKKDYAGGSLLIKF